jgi:hypothetical protein
MKKIFIFLFTTILLVGCNSNPQVIQNTSPPSAQNTNKYLVTDFKHSDVSQPIPESEKLKNYSDFFLPKETNSKAGQKHQNEYICLNESISREVPLGSYSEPCEKEGEILGCGLDRKRSAFVCDQQYVIYEFTDQFGPMRYGPYEL